MDDLRYGKCACCGETVTSPRVQWTHQEDHTPGTCVLEEPGWQHSQPTDLARALAETADLITASHATHT